MNRFPQSDSELIEAWIDNRLSSEEMTHFSDKRQSDPDFAGIVERHLLAHQALEAGIGLVLKQQLQDLRPTPPESEQIPHQGKGDIRPFWSRPAYLAIAATAVILLGIGLRWTWTNGNQSLVDRYADSYAAPPVRGKIGPDQLVNQALAAYQEENFASAKELFTQIPEEHPRYIEMRFYLANSALIGGDAAMAIENYQMVIKRQDIRFTPASEWYLILAYLDNEQKDLAREHAQSIAADEEHAYSKKAAEILLEME